MSSVDRPRHSAEAGRKRRGNRHPPYIAQWARREGLWPDKTVAQFAYDRYRQAPQRVMIVDEGVPRSCADIFEPACGLAGFLQSRGIGKGDVVSFQLPNWWEAGVVNLAAAMIGAVINPILPINRDAEVGFILRDTASKAIFLPTTYRKFDHGAMIERVIQAERIAIDVISVRGRRDPFFAFDDISRFPSAIDRPRDVDADDVKLIMYTSGTTGRAKGVLHSHNSINADSIKMRRAIGLNSDDCTFIPSPATHVTGYLWILNMPWVCDVPAVTIDRWDAERAYDLLRDHECAFMAGATPFLRDLVAVARRRDEPLLTLRNYLCGGASVPPDLIYKAARIFPNCIPWRNYGSTEAPTLTRNPDSREELAFGAETDGKIYHADVAIRHPETGEPMPDGQEGEVVVREPSMFLGYIHDEDTAKAFSPDGYFRMGDIGKIVDGEHIVITDRLKDIIIRSGENLGSKEIEDALMTSPAIKDAAVVGVPNDKTGESVFAFLVMEGEDDVDVRRLVEIITGAGLAIQKTPESICILSELPRTASGKVLKYKLREQAAMIGEGKGGG